MKKQILDFIKAVLFNLGLATLGMTVFVMLSGDQLRGFSTIGALGSAGVPVRLILQLLFLSMIVNALGRLFLSSLVIKNMKPSLRMILAAGCACPIVLGSVIFFGWIPVHETGGIVGIAVAAICFLCVFTCSARRFIRKEREENQQLADALSQYKSSHTT